ncbi:MAG: hypothetical protein NT049_03945, partial [Planctomycetota bacterium]|nr:hypothetical protein [Planctomycetota bacterium]
TIIKADQDNAVRLAAAAKPKSYTVKKTPGDMKIDGKSGEWKDLPAAPIERSGQPSKGAVKLAYDDKNLYALFEVTDTNGWQNEGKDFARLFKTGASVDIQLCVDPAAAKDAGRTKVGPADVRVVLASLNGKPAAVLMKPVDPTAKPGQRQEYVSPVGTKVFERVEVLAEAKVMVTKSGARYTVEASIPLEAIGLKPAAGMTLRGDFGFISSDAAGAINSARTYWSNPNTNLVNDLPLEAWLTPNAWGELKFE